jgi:hypothetical protein
MGITIHRDIIQGSEEWGKLRCGLLTASEMKHVITPTLKVANNDKTRAHVYELMAQRITKFVEPCFVSDDMSRGWEDEVMARYEYSVKVAPVEEVGFITNDEWGFTLGYSPDGLVGNDGLIECKSRRQKFQVETIISRDMPSDYAIQVQAGMRIANRQWLDFISYSGGLPMHIVRIHPDERIQAAIIEAAAAFEETVAAKLAEYEDAVAAMKRNGRYFPTERRVEQEMYVG